MTQINISQELLGDDISVMVERSEPVVVSLFSGLGGLDVGTELAGGRTAVCVDRDPNACRTLRTNSTRHGREPLFSEPQFSWEVLEHDVRDLNVDSDILPAAARALGRDNVTAEDVDLVVGGPPCQPFSRSNEGNRRGVDAQPGQLFQSYEAMLADLAPSGFVFENVVGLLSSNDGEDIRLIEDALTHPTNQSGEEGPEYEVSVLTVNAKNHGVPQSRERVFILGVRGDVGDPPAKKNIEGAKSPPGWSTAGEALRELEVDKGISSYRNAIRSKYAGFLERIPPGANYQHFSDRKYSDGRYVERSKDELASKEWDWRSRHWNYLLKLDPERPSWTIQAQPGSVVGPFHWRSRRLTVLEQMRLMTIPIWYEISGPRHEVQRQIGNSVPPNLACAVIGAVIEEIGFTSTTSIPRPIRSISLEDTGFGPWAGAMELLKLLHSDGSTTIRAERSEIPGTLDQLQILTHWFDCVRAESLWERAGDRPDPSNHQTYRHDTPSPSILEADVTLDERLGSTILKGEPVPVVQGY